MTDHEKHDLTNEAHRAGCAECAAVWAELDAISADARRLPLLTPSRDLWAGIESRLGESARPAVRPAPARQRWFEAPLVRYAAAAALLITVTSAVTWRIATDDAPSGGTEEVPAVAVAPTTDPAVTAAVNAEVEAALAEGGSGATEGVRAVSVLPEYDVLDDEITGLQRLLDTRRSQFDSATVAILEKNLAVIDQAITESRMALARDPASKFLNGQLARSYAAKLSLLRSTATRPTGT